jgi:Flp pilus assembly pilin Flp
MWPQNSIKDSLKATKGRSLSEYALVLALIAIVCIGALSSLGQQIGAGLKAASPGLGG